MTSPYACARCRERLPWYAAGTLPPGERAEVEEHLAGCAACHREMALWRAVGSTLDGIGETARESVVAREDMTWRGVQSRIAADGRANGSGLKERFLVDDDAVPVAVETPSAPSPRAIPGPSRRQPLVALVAAALIIALSATLFGVYGARLRVGGSSTTATTTVTPITATATVGGGACAPGQVTAHLPAHAGLSDISMVSGKDGWAVGNIRDSNAPGAMPRTLMMRFQHCAWSAVGKSIPSAELLNVAMTSASDGWAFGLTTRFVPASSAGGASWVPDQSLLLHYTNGAWQRVRVNDRHDFQYGRLRMVSKDDGWLLLYYGSESETILLYHYQGSAWTPVAPPAELQLGGISGIFTSDSDGVWISGWPVPNSNRNVVARYSAGHWQVWESPLFASSSHAPIPIRAFSPSDVWAFAPYTYEGPSMNSYTLPILHFDGAHWTRVPVSGLGKSAPAELWWPASAARPDGSVLALGIESNNGTLRPVILTCSPKGCQAQAFPVKNVAYIENISLYSPTQGFALGVDLSGVDPLTDPGSYGSVPALIMYNAGEWTRVPD